MATKIDECRSEASRAPAAQPFKLQKPRPHAPAIRLAINGNGKLICEAYDWACGWCECHVTCDAVTHAASLLHSWGYVRSTQDAQRYALYLAECARNAAAIAKAQDSA